PGALARARRPEPGATPRDQAGPGGKRAEGEAVPRVVLGAVRPGASRSRGRGHPGGEPEPAARTCRSPPVGGDAGVVVVRTAEPDPVPDVGPARDRGPAGSRGQRAPAGRSDPERRARAAGGGGAPLPLRTAGARRPGRAGFRGPCGGRGVTKIPDHVRRMAARREQARRARDFPEADRLRDRIRAAGFDLVDTPRGPELTPTSQDPTADE